MSKNNAFDFTKTGYMMERTFWVIFFTVFVLVSLTVCRTHASTKWQNITTNELKYRIDHNKDLYLINVLPKVIHDTRHVPGSINIPLGKIAQSDQLPEDKETPLIFYCMGVLWVYSPKAASLAVDRGYRDVMVYREGILGWLKAGYPLMASVVYPKVKIPLIHSKALNLERKGAAILADIRPRSHYQKGHIENSINIDLEDLPEQLDRLPKDKRIILIDHKGKLTLTTGRFLFTKGFSQVTRLDGGFNAWAKTGLPVMK